MSLSEYKKKRNSGKTPEPESKPGKGNNHKPVFVVQKHKSSHLHYDFRLEVDGVLKSWAIPKGPSTDPHDKRLAIMVEDHPLEYAGFEGHIPEGEYGTGDVEIWDSGTWEPSPGSADAERALKEGELGFYLYGNKLKGKYVLVRMEHSTAKNGWLLIKKEQE